VVKKKSGGEKPKVTLTWGGREGRGTNSLAGLHWTRSNQIQKWGKSERVGHAALQARFMGKVRPPWERNQGK